MLRSLIKAGMMLLFLGGGLFLWACSADSSFVDSPNDVEFGFNLPTFLEVDAHDYIYVYNTGSMYKLNPLGELSFAFSVPMSEAVGIDGDDNVYAAGILFKGAFVYNSQGIKTGTAFTDYTISDFCFVDNDIFLLSTLDSAITHLNKDGVVISRWSEDLLVPTRMAYSGGYLYILSPQNSWVYRYSIFGVSSGGWSVTAPAAICATPDGYIYIVTGNIGDNRILVYDRLGTPVKTWGKTGTGFGELGISVGDVAIDSLRNLYVSDTMAGKIVVYDSQGECVDEWR